MGNTIFSKIINREIPAKIIYETDNILAFYDINAQAPTHVLIIPKVEIPTILDFNKNKHSELLVEMFEAAIEIARKEKIDRTGFRLVINCNSEGGQEVYHLHMHILGGRQMNWPPG
ncbi:MAG: histidine triad nucleotide-binding protein [Ignavibacteriales bacterium]|nr:histidine triad nucleotide-binding protein [Ignavibacteriales bacterium]